MSQGNGTMPAGWVVTELGDIAELIMGQSPPGSSTNTRGEGVPLIGGASDVIDGMGPVTSRHTTSPTKLSKPEDIILCIRATIGRPVFAGDEFCLGRGVAGIRAHGVDPTWLLEYLRASEPRLTECGTGTTFKTVARADIASLDVALPPLAEQGRIVARVQKLRARTRRAREALEGVPALLEKFRQSVLASAFRGDLTADWRESHPDVEPAWVLLERIRAERRRQWEEMELEKMRAKGKEPKDDRWKQKYKEPEPLDTRGLPELPEGWAWASVEQLSSAVDTVCYGVVQPGKEIPDGVPLVRVCDIDSGQVAASGFRTISADIDRQYERSRLRGNEVLLTVVGTIGRVAVVPESLSGTNIARAVARIVPVASIPSEWVAFALQSPWHQQWLTREAREVARMTLNIGTLTQTAIPVAPFSEIKAILELLPAMLQRAAAIERGAASIQPNLEKQEQAILAKALRGELIPQDPNDEPASVLLKRIREERDKNQKRGRNSQDSRSRVRRPCG